MCCRHFQVSLSSQFLSLRRTVRFFFFLSGPFRYLMVGWSTTLSLLARKMVIVMYEATKKKKKIGKGEIFCSEQQETATCCYSGCC